MVEPIAYADPLIDLRSDRIVPYKLKYPPQILVCELVLTEQPESSSDFQREPAVFLPKHESRNDRLTNAVSPAAVTAPTVPITLVPTPHPDSEGLNQISL